MTVEIAFPTDDLTIQEFTHPNGETGILIGLTTDESALGEAFDLEVEGDSPVVIPFKHKADGATNFETYRDEGDETTIVFADDHYQEIRSYLRRTL